MAKMGRKTKYTPERVARILELLRGGNTRKCSAEASGVDHVTMLRWLARYDTFADDVQKAEAEAEALHIQNIVTAAEKGSWQASAWWTERRRHEAWGRKDRIEVVNTVREQARNAGVDESEAVGAAEQILRELRSAQRA